MSFRRNFRLRAEGPVPHDRTPNPETSPETRNDRHPTVKRPRYREELPLSTGHLPHPEQLPWGHDARYAFTVLMSYLCSAEMISFFILIYYCKNNLFENLHERTKSAKLI
jgi:hypothetical protein